MNSPALPPCLYALQTRAWGTRLVLARCNYAASRFDDDAYAIAGIPAPTTLNDAIAKRRTEYLAGRLCARAALQEVLGMSTVPEIGADRAPLWPPGAVGAITHGHGEAAALVGDQRQWQGLGLDHEHWLAPARAERLRHELLTAEENAALEGLTAQQRARHVTLTFSVKESLFKALYPLTGRRFYFQDAALSDDHITLRTDLSTEWSAGTALPFQFEEDTQGVLSWITVPADRAPA